jgi:serine/threonine protein kinase
LKNLPDFKGSFPKWEKPSLKNFVPNLSDKGIDFLERLLELNPDKRITAQQALEHEYLSDIVLTE